MKVTIIIGGKAGQGPNILTEVVAESLIKAGYYVFYSRDYQSLIRGGHNFNSLTFSDKPIHSNNSKADILICLDDKTEELHKKELNKKALILKGEESNMFFAGSVLKVLGLDINLLEDALKPLKNFEENMKQARHAYYSEKRELKIEKLKEKHNLLFMNGNQGISKGAILSGLEYYYGYPMTPATPVLMELGNLTLKKDSKHKIIELENEIAVIMAGLGSAIVGARSMVGTSGGGFDLMTEGLSLAGQAEIPIVIYLASRPGPSTGLATYTSQDSLNLALYAGHGDFNRIVIAPGDALESIEACNQAFYFSQKFRIPAIVLGDKHLAESKSLVKNYEKLVEIKNSITSPERFNSYEHDENGVATEEPSLTKKNFERRLKINKEIAKEAQKFEQYKIYGKRDSRNIILGFGSTKGAILDALENEGKPLDAKFIQITYMEPFSDKIKKELESANRVIIVENNSTSQLSTLIANKTGFIIEDKNKILRYDGRPFLSDELSEEIKRRLK